MRREFTWYRNVILGALGAVIAADLALAAYSYQVDSAAGSPQKEIAQLIEQRKLLQGDVARARTIQKDIPKTKADCVTFENSLPPSGNGYSIVSTELSDLAHKSGLHLGTVAFHQKDLAGKGVSEITIDATVEGDYKSVVKFLNSLQRSQNTYAVEDLALVSDNSNQAPIGKVRVNLHVTSYFRATV